MTDNNARLRKRNRVKIENIDDLMQLIKKEGYDIKKCNELNYFFKEKYYLNSEELKVLNQIVIDNYAYKINDLDDLIDYMRCIIKFNYNFEILINKIKYINMLKIERTEYDRKPYKKDDVDDILKKIERIKDKITGTINEKDIKEILEIENEIKADYIFSKDVELLKEIIDKRKINSIYDDKLKISTITYDINEKITIDYIKHVKGSYEYHEYLLRNIPRLERLIKNLYKYIQFKDENKGESYYFINQSDTILDSINVAQAYYDGKRFKAVSGSCVLENYVQCMSKEDSVFKSFKVNKRGVLGTGYNRNNDSEKKILEEIHKQIVSKKLNSYGRLILCTKREPCPSCYYVLYQFSKMYPNIDICVRFSEKYGYR